MFILSQIIIIQKCSSLFYLNNMTIYILKREFLYCFIQNLSLCILRARNEPVTIIQTKEDKVEQLREILQNLEAQDAINTTTTSLKDDVIVTKEDLETPANVIKNVQTELQAEPRLDVEKDSDSTSESIKKVQEIICEESEEEVETRSVAETTAKLGLDKVSGGLNIDIQGIKEFWDS